MLIDSDRSKVLSLKKHRWQKDICSFELKNEIKGEVLISIFSSEQPLTESSYSALRFVYTSKATVLKQHVVSVTQYEFLFLYGRSDGSNFSRDDIKINCCSDCHSVCFSTRSEDVAVISFREYRNSVQEHLINFS